MRTRRHRHERLSPVVQRYFDAWVDRDTWDSWHPLDDEHFYRFVKAVARSSRRRPPRPGDIHALIVARWRGKRRADQLTERAEHFRQPLRDTARLKEAEGGAEEAGAGVGHVDFFFTLGFRRELTPRMRPRRRTK